ncbi:glycosyltransferase family 2 protein [uncultured Prevotella sp.]|uniref:glycosyltransferase family 2 protein n=1 Tax=uncultured Prevotella sp. TaxID=159272 RepID=UPI002590F271|nr:glycosyltransferase family 2 protein [uncultured Prevotella sp.]
MNKLVTVSIASFNNALYIERCLDSVVSQSYSNIEILIVDDGSTDDTISRVAKYEKDGRVRIIRKENGGLSTVRQMCLDEAVGEYICFIDADDFLKENFISSMLSKLTYDQSDICVCSTRFESENGDYLRKESVQMSCDESEKPIVLQQESKTFLKDKITETLHLSDSWNKMYKVSFLKECGVCFCMPKGKNGSDSLFNRLIALHSPRYSTIKDDVYVHVIYSRSAVHRKKKDLLSSYMLITRLIKEECVKLGIYDSMKKYVSCYYLSSLCTACHDVYNEAKSMKEAKQQLKELQQRSKKFVVEKEIDLNSIKYSDIRSVPLKVFVMLSENFQLLIPYYFKIMNVIR